MLIRRSLAFVVLAVFVFNMFSLYNVFAYSHTGGLFPQSQIDIVLQKIETGSQPWKGAYDQLISEANARLIFKPNPAAIIDCPNYYDDPDGFTEMSQRLAQDVYAAYSLSMAYKLTNKPSYADSAITVLNSWAKTNTGFGAGTDSKLVMVTVGTGFIFSAELLFGYSGWNTADYNIFKNWVTNVYKSAADGIALYREDNRKTWGILGRLAYSHLLDDSVSFTNAVSMLKEQIDTTIEADGHMPGEIARESNGIWYTYFALAPMTAGCQIIKNATGEDLFNWTSPNGKQIKKALDYLFYYAQHPEEWPYYTNPSVPSPAYNAWPVNLFEVMSDVYHSSSYANYAAVYRPILGGMKQSGYTHSAWTFPTLMLQEDCTDLQFTSAYNLARDSSSAFKSTCKTGNEADKVKDGNIGTRWAPALGDYNGYVGLDFGVNKQTFNKAVIAEYATPDTFNISSYSIECADSTNGPWTPLASEAVPNVGIGTRYFKHTFPTVTARYIRFKVLSNNGKRPYIAEMEVYNTEPLIQTDRNYIIDADMGTITNVPYVDSDYNVFTSHLSALNNASYTVQTIDGTTVNSGNLRSGYKVIAVKGTVKQQYIININPTVNFSDIVFTDTPMGVDPFSNPIMKPISGRFIKASIRADNMLPSGDTSKINAALVIACYNSFENTVQKVSVKEITLQYGDNDAILSAGLQLPLDSCKVKAFLLKDTKNIIPFDNRNVKIIE